MFYRIEETLKEAAFEEALDGSSQYVAVLTPEEWRQNWEKFQMGIEMEIERHPHTTKAEVNYDSLTGAFSVPDRWELTERDHEFAFALDEKGVVIIDEDGYARKLVEKIVKTKRWRVPSLERFFSDFLETMIRGDSTFLEALEDEISRIEEDILEGRAQKDVLSRITDIRGDLLALRIHYEQMIDFGQELASNDNAFFKEDKIHYFDNYVNRVIRLLDIVNSLRDYSVQTRDLYQSQLAVRQNNTVTVLTVVTTIFMPLTLIVGWYGMNFKYMPELESPLGYPLVILFSAVIIIGSLIYFKYKKWL